MGGLSERRVRELERAATAWLLEHDPLARSRREADRGPLVAWQMSPVEVPDVDEDQDDAGEIARTFADLSGGRLMPRFAAWTWILDDGCNMKRADGCKHHLYPARNNKNVLSFLSFTRQNAKSVHCLSAAACGWGQRHSRFELFPPTAAIPCSPGDRRSFPRKHSACHIFESGGCE